MSPPEDEESSFGFEIDAEDAGQRLDRFLVNQDLEVSRSQLKRHIEGGFVRVNGEPSRVSRKLRQGDRIAYSPPPLESYDEVEPEAIPLSVLFEDDDLIVVDKAAGMVVHPAPGHPRGTLVAALLAHCDRLSGIGGVQRPGIVHRLDRLTSGVMVASKSDRAHEGLARQFASHDIERRYLAIVRGHPRQRSWIIDTLHGRHPVDRKRYTTKVKRGRRAMTHVEVRCRLDKAALVEARLETGRTHQVRVHLAEEGHPLVGDPVYGGRQGDGALRELGRALGRQALHARLLAFEHPLSGERMSFETELPEDMTKVLEALRPAG